MIPVSICQVVERLNGIKTHSFQIQQRTWINYWLKSCRHWGSKRSSLVFVPSCPVLSLRSFQSLWIHGRYICQIIHLTWNCGLGNLTWCCHNIEKKMKSQSNHLWNSPSSIFPESSPPLLLFLSARAAARTTYTGKVASFTVFKICEKSPKLIQYFLGLTLNIIMPVDADVHMIFCPKCSWHKPP